MTAVWPAGLPQFVAERGYGESLPVQTIESPMDSGQVKSRRRFTGNWRQMAAIIECLPEQVPIFEHFYLDTLEAGTQPFLWVNPRTQIASLFRFRKPEPAYSPFGSVNIAIQMQLWQLRQYAGLRFDSTLWTFDSTERRFDEATRF